MKKLFTLLAILFIADSSYSEGPKKVLCELEGNYSITYDDFRRNYFNEAVEIAKNVAVTTTQSIFFLNRAKQTLNKDAWDKNKIDVIQYWALDIDMNAVYKVGCIGVDIIIYGCISIFNNGICFYHSIKITFI